MPRDLSPVLPSAVEVHFSPYPCGTVSYADIPTDYDYKAEIADADLEVSAGSGSSLGVHDACHAIYSASGGDPSNASTLETLAKRVAKDVWGWRLIAYDRNYVGIVAPAPDATVGAVVWSYRADGASTRMASEPIGGEPIRLGHADAEHDCDGRPLVYGGADHTTFTSGTLKLPRQRLDIVDGALRWFKQTPESLVICPQTQS